MQRQCSIAPTRLVGLSLSLSLSVSLCLALCLALSLFLSLCLALSVCVQRPKYVLFVAFAICLRPSPVQVVSSHLYWQVTHDIKFVLSHPEAAATLASCAPLPPRKLADARSSALLATATSVLADRPFLSYHSMLLLLFNYLHYMDPHIRYRSGTCGCMCV